MSHEALAGDQLGHTAAVEVGQHEAVGLRPGLIYEVLPEGDLVSVADLLVPEDAVAMRGGGDDVVEAIAVDIIDEDLRGMVHFAVQAAQGQGMLDPLAVARVGGGLEPGVGPDDVRAAIAVDIAHADAPGHGLVRNNVLGERPPPVRSFDHLVPNSLGHRWHHRLGLAVADDVVKAGGLIVAVRFDEGLGPLAVGNASIAEPDGMLIEPIYADQVWPARAGDFDGQ